MLNFIFSCTYPFTGNLWIAFLTVEELQKSTFSPKGKKNIIIIIIMSNNEILNFCIQFSSSTELSKVLRLLLE